MCPGVAGLSTLLRHGGVLALVTAVFLLAWVGVLPPASAMGGNFLAYSAATNTYTISPSGFDDTTNLQAAFEGCAATGSECTVQLGSGVFHTAQIVVRDFHGTFRGMGQALTKIEALPDLPLGEFVTKPPSADNPWPVLFTFFDGTYAIRDMTFSEPWAEPLPAWEPCTGCGLFHALFAVISVTGLSANVVVDRITMVGAPGDWTFGGPVAYNTINGIFPQALVLGKGKKDFSRVLPLQVNFEMTNSQFYMIDNPSGGENLEDSTYTARFNTLDNMEYGFWFVDVGNSMVDVSHNILRNVIYGTGIIAYQNRPINVWMPCQPHSDILIAHNDVQYTATAYGVLLVDYADRFGCMKSLNGVISGNTLRADDTSWDAIVVYMMGSAAVSGNTIIGPAASGVWIWKGAAVVTGNTFLGAQVGVALQTAIDAVVQHNEIRDSWYVGIWTMLESSNNRIVQNDVTDSGWVDLAWDMTGTGNVWIKNECQTSDPPGLCPAG